MIESFGKELQGGNVPAGVDEMLFLAWLNVVLEESEEINEIDGVDFSAAGDILAGYSAKTASLIDECQVPNKGTSGITGPLPTGSPESWSLAGFLAAALMLL